MNLFWLPTAEEDLDLLYHYYAKDKSKKYAVKIYNEILDSAEQLVDFPEMGIVEQELSEDKNEYRSLLVRRHFKLVYLIEKSSVYVIALFDCRQDPKTNKQKINKSL